MTLRYTQRAILTSLSGGDRTIRALVMDWPGLSESSVRASLNRLYKHGFVEPARWVGSSREWEITRKGQEALDESGTVEEEE